MAVFIPRNRKYLKSFKFVRSMGFVALRKELLYSGCAGVQADGPGALTSNQMEAVRRALVRFLRPYSGNLYLYTFASLPLTHKPVEVRMGKGKGGVQKWVQRVQKGRLLLEVGGVALPVALRACEFARVRLGVKTRVIFRR